jgi:hypothetical protein
MWVYFYNEVSSFFNEVSSFFNEVLNGLIMCAIDFSLKANLKGSNEANLKFWGLWIQSLEEVIPSINSDL